MKPKRLLEATDQSLNERMQAVQNAVRLAYRNAPTCCYSYASIVFDDYVIIQLEDGRLVQTSYTLNPDGTATLGTDATPVRHSDRSAYVPISEGTICFMLADDDKVKEGEDASKAPATGKRWAVAIIQEGMSKNRNRYQRKVLQEAAPLYEGAKIYMDHEEETRRYGRSTQHVAGFLKGVQGALLGTKESDTATFALHCTAVVTKPNVRQEMLEAYEEGNPNLFGFSHDVQAESVTCMAEDGPFYDVQRIESVSSVDLVTNPAAGGRVLRLVASDTKAHTLLEDGRMLTKMIEAIKASGNAELIAKLTALGGSPNEDQVMALYQDALKPAAIVPKVEAAAPTPAAVTTGSAQITEAQFMEVRRDGLISFVESAVGGTSLHDPVKDQLRTRLTAVINEAKSMDALPAKSWITSQVKETVDLFAMLAEKNVVMPAAGVPRAQVIKDRRDKIEDQVDAFFGVRRESQTDGTVKVRLLSEADRPTMSFRNFYIDVTGDVSVTGLVKEARKLTESLNSTSFDQLLGDSITRRMVAEYQLQTFNEWRGRIADVVPISDFRVQRRMRFGGYGNLAIVAQGAPYASMTSPTDEEATYTPAKRGGTEQLTIEMIANDDVGAIRRIPQRLSRAAYQTLREFIFDFMATNPTIYDGGALAVAGKNNIITTALTSTNLSSARLKLKKQADMSNGKRIGLQARYLWVPTDLEELAFQLTSSDRVMPDSAVATTAAAAAPNYHRKIGIEPITVDYWTDVDNYWVTADISQTPMIEIGFWGGEDPQLFVQDVPNVGSLFANDALTYKMRHVYGGGVLDYRGFVGGIV